MTTLVIITTLCAALLHAVWNALVKNTADKLVSMTALAVGVLPLSIGALFFVPAPHPDSWPYIVSGAALHIIYQYFLLNSYRLGDLTHVYPLARGSAPLMVAFVSVAFLGIHLSQMELLCIFLIGAGIMSMSLARQSDGLRNPKAAAAALLTGLMIASYSINDGIGARQAGTAIGFYSWLTILNAIVFTGVVMATRRDVVPRMHREAKWVLYGGSNASYVAYVLVIWAFTQAPIALVTALREMSILFALAIGVFFLKEKLNVMKIISSFVTITGAVLLRFAR